MKEKSPSVHEGYWLVEGTVLHERYEVETVVAEGGMGIVYLGYDKLLRTKVSIKEYFPRKYAMRVNETRLRAYEGDARRLFDSGLEKFIEEARTLARFGTFESIVSVRDFFHENDTGYIVMEYVEGDTVKEEVEEKGKMSPKMVLESMQPVLRSLSAIHESGLLHRDIAPDNLILRPNGSLVLVDFGTARFLSDDDEKTMTIFFKSGYSANEQYAPDTEKGPYTDVYGVCSTMYFMLTGIKPQESIRRILKDQVVPLNKFSDISLSKEEKELIMKGMAIRSQNRIQNIDELYRGLYEKPVEPDKNATLRRIGKRVVVLVLLVAAMGVCIRIGALFGGGESPTAVVSPTPRGNVAVETSTASPTASPKPQKTKKPEKTPKPTKKPPRKTPKPKVTKKPVVTKKPDNTKKKDEEIAGELPW